MTGLSWMSAERWGEVVWRQAGWPRASSTTLFLKHESCEMDIPERSKQKWILDGSGNGESYTQARNDKRPGTGTRHTSARGQQQLLEGLGNRSQPAEVKKVQNCLHS